jgi:3-hydroxyisobutyrate dehydrogenase-like beta-hydroxyacid dehydrogenase
MLAFCNTAAAAEALMIGKRSGIALTKLDAVIRNASDKSAGYASLSRETLAGDFTASCAVDLGRKDLRLALQKTRRARPDSASGHESDGMARGTGLGSSDSSAWRGSTKRR